MDADRAPPSRPRIIRLIPVLDFGGVESIFALQSRLLDRQRFDFRVCTFWKRGSAAKAIEANGVVVDELGVDPAIRNPAATLALARYLRERKPDIVHSSIGEANFHLALVAKAVGVRIAIIEEQGLPNRRLPARLVHAALYRMVDAIVGVSDAACRYLVEKEYAPRQKVSKINNSARPEFYAPHVRSDANGKPFTALTVGRLVEVKNQACLIRAFRKVVDHHPEARLQLAGDGPLRTSLEGLIRELGLIESVELLGFRDDVLELMLRADVCVLPSLSEGFGLALAEAMAVGTPVIGANVGGIPEVMEPLGSEWLVESTDGAGWTRALCRMIELGPEQRAALGRRAQSASQRFAPGTNIAAVQGLYDQLLNQRQA